MLTACSSEVANEDGGKHNIVTEGNWTSINDDVFISTGSSYNVNLILVTSGKEVTLIDTGKEEEEALRAQEYIEKNGLVLKNIILTHMDKVNNISVFQTKDTKVFTPLSSENNQTIVMGDKSFKILTTAGYADNNHMSIELNENILFAGDIITSKEDMPVIKTNKNLTSLIETLEGLKTKNYNLIVPAHGPIIENNIYIDEYLHKLKELIATIDIREEDKLKIINEDIIVSTGNYEKVNMTLVVSGQEATLIDAGNDKSEALEIQKYISDNKLKLKNIILTHEHQDHINNLDLFLEDDVKLYKYDDLQNNELTITMGDKTLKMLATPGHFDDKHMSVELNDTILIAGDIMSTNIRPEKLVQYGGTKEALTKTLEALNKNNYSLIIPGHGDICIGNDIIQEHLDSLKSSN